jgi:hypothetical protein
MKKKDLDILIKGHKYEEDCEFGGHNLHMDGVYFLTDVSVPQI